MSQPKPFPTIKTCLSLVVFLVSMTVSLAQDGYWEKWNKNYKEVDVEALLRFERQYADSVNQDAEAAKLYSRKDGYRFLGTFTGQLRDLSEDRREAMKITFSLFSGKNEVFDQISQEVQIRVGTELIWMPIQPILEAPFKEEIKKNRDVYLYTLYLNHHNLQGTLYNLFLISEFIKQ